jgi:hypothetical protein
MIVFLQKIFLPSFRYSEIKPIAKLLKPSNLLVPMFFVINLAQIISNFVGFLDTKELEKLYSVKFYSKMIFSGKITNYTTAIQSIAKTLSSELETLCILSTSERLNLIKKLVNYLINNEYYNLKNNLNYDPISLFNYRKLLCIQFKSLMISTAIFNSNSLSIGISIKQINMETIISSCEELWNLLGLEREEFHFLLLKEGLIDSYSKKNYLNLKESLKTILYNELRSLLNFTNSLNLNEDKIVFKSQDNLTLLERELGFINRFFPKFSSNILVFNNNIHDPLLKAAIYQRNLEKIKINNSFNSSVKQVFFLRNLKNVN